jgi:two-component system response regulator CpxR
VLIVDDDPSLRWVLAEALLPRCDVDAADSAAQARTRLANHEYEVVLCDLELQDGSGLDVLELFKRLHPETTRMLMTGTDLDRIVADPTLVHYMFRKPFSLRELGTAIERATRDRRPVILSRAS